MHSASFQSVPVFAHKAARRSASDAVTGKLVPLGWRRINSDARQNHPRATLASDILASMRGE